MNLKLLIQLIILILFYIIFGNSLVFYLISYILSIIFTLPRIIEGIKEKSLKKNLIILPSYLLFLFMSYYVIISNNPINYILLYLLPFRNIFKALALILANFYVIEYLFKKKESLNSIEKTDLIKDENSGLLLKNRNDYNLVNAKKLRENKIIIPLIFFTLVLIKLIRFYYDNYLFIYVNKKDSLLPNVNETKYYICSDLYNNEKILENWIEQMKILINYLGPENVYISIIENGDSDDKTAPMLQEFGKYLNESNITNKIITHKIIQTEGRHKIEYLIDLRNAALAFLFQIPNLNFNKTKILFFNDIIFKYQDIIRLINTNKGDYDIACGMDYDFTFYNSLISIDLDGKNFRNFFPYIINKVGQDAIIDNGLLRVFSCWNGVASMKALPFENKTIKFRSIHGYKESECTILNYDFYKAGFQKILVNTNLVFAYNHFFYFLNKFVFPLLINFNSYFYYYILSIFYKNNYLMKNYVDERYTPGKGLSEKFEYFEKENGPQYINNTNGTIIF